MKTYIHFLFMCLITLLVMPSCQNEDIDTNSFKIERERVFPTADSVSITGSYSFAGTVIGMKINIGEEESLIDANVYNMQMEGSDFSATIGGLKPSTKYYYCYSVNFGTNNALQTETKSFTTLNATTQTPTVKTLDILPIDSITFRVDCEVESDGGEEVTERGICWNTYGNPNMSDDTIRHNTGGTGQYSIRIEHLALGKKYYVRAYAKNAAGYGLSEEVLEFETEAPVGMPVDIIISPNPEEGGSVNGGGSYEVGTLCTVVAMANIGYTFVNWTENGSQVSSEASYSFPVTVERHLVANFTKQAFAITAEVTPENSGNIEGTGVYNYGDECTLKATAESGYKFEKWTKNGNTVYSEAQYSFLVTETANYVAHFLINSYTINVSVNPENSGSVEGGGTFNHGQTCTLHATPAEGYSFTNWTDESGVVSTDTCYTFTVNSNRNLVANFISNQQYNIEIAASPAAGGSVIGGGYYNQGQSCTVEAIANSGYKFINWTENDNIVTTNPNYQFIVNSNRNLVAHFNPVGTINGLFTINSNNDQVYFSEGNLQYQASTNTWRFAEQQWKYIGDDNTNISPNYNGWIDLFCFGTSGYEHGARCWQPWSTSQNHTDYYAYGSYNNNLFDGDGRADWGYNEIHFNDYIIPENSGWRTLSSDEWTFLFDRPNSWAKGTVNDACGIILLPDNWDSSAIPLNNTNPSNGSSYSDNSIFYSDWINLYEANGAVFLPAAGSRVGTTVNGADAHGFYRASTYYNNEMVDNIYFMSGFFQIGHNNRYKGMSVRLVRPVQKQ